MSEASVARDAPEREPRDIRRRRQLIDATIRSIARHGLEGTTVLRVAKGAGLSAGIVNFYFKSKKALLLATLDTVSSEFEQSQRDAISRAGDDPAAQLEALIEVSFDPEICDPDRIAVWNAFWGQGQTRADYMRVCGAREQADEDLIVSLFQRLARAGDHAQLDADSLGMAFYHLLSSLPEGVLEHDTPFDFDKARATCRGFLASVFPERFRAGASQARDLAPKGVAPGEQEFETLPTWVYRDREFYELEKQHIFMSHWLLVGHASHVPAPGDYMTLEVAEERALVIRGKDARLRAFHNTCRHRAARLVGGANGNCPSAIVCPYHGFSYGFDGSLQSVPAEQRFERLDKSSMGLLELELEEWQGFVFLRFGGDGPGVAASLAPFTQELRHYRFEELQPWTARETTTHAFNWKLFAENDAEGYHIPTGHPGLRRLFGNSYVDDTRCADESRDGSRSFSRLVERESTNWVERAYQRILPPVDHLPKPLQRAWVYYSLFPSAVFQVRPDQVECYQMLPQGPDSSRLMTFSMALEDDRREMRAARYLTSRIVRQVVKEDLQFCSWTHAGMHTSAYRGGMLSDLESGVRALQERIRELIPVARCAEKPGALARAGQDLAAQNEAMRLTYG